MISKFDIEFEVSDTTYIATAENYLMPGQIRVTNISPVLPGFSTEIVFDKDHNGKKLIYDKGLDHDAQIQIIEAVHRKAKEEGRPLYLDEMPPK